MGTLIFREGRLVIILHIIFFNRKMLNWNLIPRLLHNAAFDAFVTIIVDCCAKTRWVGLNCLLEEEGR